LLGKCGWLVRIGPLFLGANSFGIVSHPAEAVKTTVVRDAWSRRQALTIHGWIYALRDGLLQDLDMCVTGEAELQDRYEQARAGVRRRTS